MLESHHIYPHRKERRRVRKNGPTLKEDPTRAAPSVGCLFGSVNGGLILNDYVFIPGPAMRKNPQTACGGGTVQSTVERARSPHTYIAPAVENHQRFN